MRGASASWVFTLAVAAMMVTACTNVGGQHEMAQTIAERLADEVAGELADAAGSPDGAGPDVLADAVGTIESPDGVRVFGTGRVKSRTAEGRTIVSTALVVVPDDADSYCVIVATASDGSAAGVRAEGDPLQSCRDASTAGPAPSPIDDEWR